MMMVVSKFKIFISSLALLLVIGCGTTHKRVDVTLKLEKVEVVDFSGVELLYEDTRDTHAGTMTAFTRVMILNSSYNDDNNKKYFNEHNYSMENDTFIALYIEDSIEREIATNFTAAMAPLKAHSESNTTDIQKRFAWLDSDTNRTVVIFSLQKLQDQGYVPALDNFSAISLRHESSIKEIKGYTIAKVIEHHIISNELNITAQQLNEAYAIFKETHLSE